MSFTVSEFYWNRRRIGTTDLEVEAAVECLNKLSPEQETAVRLYGRSCKEEGYDEGLDAS